MNVWYGGVVYLWEWERMKEVLAWEGNNFKGTKPNYTDQGERWLRVGHKIRLKTASLEP